MVFKRAASVIRSKMPSLRGLMSSRSKIQSDVDGVSGRDGPVNASAGGIESLNTKKESSRPIPSPAAGSETTEAR